MVAITGRWSDAGLSRRAFGLGVCDVTAGPGTGHRSLHRLTGGAAGSDFCRQAIVRSPDHDPSRVVELY
jgi:hypothetical protein